MIKTKFVALLALCLGLGLAQAQTQPQTLHYTVSGFSGGGTADLLFTGTDLNNDGALVWLGAGNLGNELSAFSLAFTGDSALPAFNLGLADLLQLHHTSTSFALQAAGHAVTLNGPVAVSVSYVYDEAANTALGAAVAAPLNLAPVISQTMAPPVAAPVPEPQTAAMWLAGLAASAFMLRRRRG